MVSQIEFLDEAVVSVADDSLIKLIATFHRWADPNDKDCEQAKQQVPAIHFICGNNTVHEGYLKLLHHSFLHGENST